MVERERIGPAIGALYIGAALGFGYVIYDTFIKRKSEQYSVDPYYEHMITSDDVEKALGGRVDYIDYGWGDTVTAEVHVNNYDGSPIDVKIYIVPGKPKVIYYELDTTGEVINAWTYSGNTDAVDERSLHDIWKSSDWEHMSEPDDLTNPKRVDEIIESFSSDQEWIEAENVKWYIDSMGKESIIIQAYNIDNDEQAILAKQVMNNIHNQILHQNNMSGFNYFSPKEHEYQGERLVESTYRFETGLPTNKDEIVGFIKDKITEIGKGIPEFAKEFQLHAPINFKKGDKLVVKKDKKYGSSWPLIFAGMSNDSLDYLEEKLGDNQVEIHLKKGDVITLVDYDPEVDWENIFQMQLPDGKLERLYIEEFNFDMFEPKIASFEPEFLLNAPAYISTEQPGYVRKYLQNETLQKMDKMPEEFQLLTGQIDDMVIRYSVLQEIEQYLDTGDYKDTIKSIIQIHEGATDHDKTPIKKIAVLIKMSSDPMSMIQEMMGDA